MIKVKSVLKQLSSGMGYCVVWHKFTDVLEGAFASEYHDYRGPMILQFYRKVLPYYINTAVTLRTSDLTMLLFTDKEPGFSYV